jgi:hypothetical protein
MNGSAAGDFVGEGLQIYYDISITLRDFRRRVYRICTDVLAEHEVSLSKVGIPWSQANCDSSGYPDWLDDERWEEEWAVLSVGVPLQGLGHFYLGLYWNRDDAGGMTTQAYAGLGLNSAKARDRAWELLSQTLDARMQRDLENNEIFVTAPIQSPEQKVVTERLREVIVVWTKLLLKVGGLKAVRTLVNK